MRWAAALPHANGSVGAYGPSYLGITQLMTAAAIGPNSPLKAIFPIVASNDPFRDMAGTGGMTNVESDVPLIAAIGVLNMLAPVIDGAPSTAELLSLLAEHARGTLEGNVGLGLDVLLERDRAFYGPWWSERAQSGLLQRIVDNGIPAFLTGGWFDVFQRGSPLNYMGLQNAWSGRPPSAPMDPGQPVTGRYQLYMGPVYHSTTSADGKLDPIALRWFDRWLKNRENGIDDTTDPLHLNVMGAKRDVDESHWPLPQAPVETLYLGPGRAGSGAPSFNDGRLTPTPPAGAGGADTLLWSPLTSICSRSAHQWALGAFAGFPACHDDDRSIQVGPHALTYTTQPFAAPKVIAGPIGATLFATSNRPETQLVVTIEDVAPDGKSTGLTNGLLLGSQRATDPELTWLGPGGRPYRPWHPFTRAARRPVPVGAVTRHDVEVFATTAEIARGHRLRVTVATADTPRVIPLPSQLLNLIGGVYELQRNAAHASSVQIPMAAPADLATPCTICP